LDRAVEVGRVLSLDGKGKIRAEYNVGARIYSCVGADLNGDGHTELLATDRQGFLHCLDENLQLIQKVQVVPNPFSMVSIVRLEIVEVESLGSKQSPRIILKSAQQEILAGGNTGNERITINQVFLHDVSVLVLDAQFHRVAQYLIAKKVSLMGPEWGVKLYDWDGDHQPEFLLLGPEVRIVKLKGGL
jgi:hypothetical protein